MKEYSVLLIDDHPIILDVYEMKFNQIANSELKFKIIKEPNYEKVVAIIKDKALNGKFDIVLLDLRLGKSKDGTIHSGEELGILLNKLMPDIKIIVSTSYNDAITATSVINRINPIGFLIKTDFDYSDLQKVIEVIISGNTFYCNTVTKIINKRFKSNFNLDSVDKKILYELSIGTKISNIPNYVPLSKAGIEKRIQCLKKNFCGECNSNRQLVLNAKERGYL